MRHFFGRFGTPPLSPIVFRCHLVQTCQMRLMGAWSACLSRRDASARWALKVAPWERFLTYIFGRGFRSNAILPKNSAMRRKLNVKLVASFLAGLLCASGAVHFLHGYQLQRNAYRLLELGDRAVEENDDVKALTCYSQYLNFLPNDADTVQKYAQVLDRHAATGADRVRLILLMEQVLRVKPNEHPLRF